MMRFRGSVAMDDYLATLGLWRKPTARDKSCLFRAVSEQLFHTQCLHQRLKKVCNSFVERHREELEEECRDHGQLDIVALSILFKRDFVVYREVNRAPVEITQNGYRKPKIVLCFSDGHHYDSVYPRSYIESAAICQSITYELLYREVFGMDTPVEKGQDMISTKPYKPRPDVTVSTSPDSICPMYPREAWDPHHDMESPVDYNKEHVHCSKDKAGHKIVPFPYKVAKALAPDIYRNVELDAWIEAKKELGLNGELEEDDNTFSPGDKCQVTLEEHPDRVFNAHIQEIVPDHGPITVFVEELGEKHKVQLNSLKPLPQSIKQGWNSSDDGQSGYRKRKKKKVPTAMVIGINSNLPPRMQHQGGPAEDYSDHREGGTPVSPVTFGLPLARHLSPRCHPLPRGRPRSYSEGAASSGQPIPSNAEYTNHGPVPPAHGEYTAHRSGCPGAEGAEVIHNHMATTSTPPTDPGHRQPEAGYKVIMEAVPGTVHPIGPSPAPPAPSHNHPGLHTYQMSTVPVQVTHIDNCPINYNATTSCDPSGSDLPLHDLVTLRYFYNLGIEYYRHSVCMVPVPQPLPVTAQPPPPPHPQQYTAGYTTTGPVTYNHMVPTYVTVPMQHTELVHRPEEEYATHCGGAYSSQHSGGGGGPVHGVGVAQPPPPPPAPGGTVFYPYVPPNQPPPTGPGPPHPPPPPPQPQPQYL